jgi:hypothetical protein
VEGIAFVEGIEFVAEGMFVFALLLLYELVPVYALLVLVALLEESCPLQPANATAAHAEKTQRIAFLIFIIVSAK